MECAGEITYNTANGRHRVLVGGTEKEIQHLLNVIYKNSVNKYGTPSIHNAYFTPKNGD